MPDITLTFSNDINISAQIGDTAYYSAVTSNGGFNTSTQSDIYEIGPIKSITGKVIICNPTNVTSTTNPPAGSFILFSKDNKVNMTSPIGYFAQVKLVNNSSIRSELFAVACDVTESSK